MLKMMIMITMEPKLVMGCDKFYENNVISYKFKQFDITAKLSDNNQNLHQWADDEHKSTLLYMTIVPNYL